MNENAPAPDPQDQDASPADDSVPQKQRPRFGLQAWAVAAWIIYALYVVSSQWAALTGAETSEQHAEALGRMTGGAAGFPLTCLLIAWVIWIPFKSRTVASVVFTALLGLSVLGQADQRSEGIQEERLREALEEFRSASENLRRENLSALEAGRTPSLVSNLQRLERAFRTAGDRVDGPYRAMMHVTADAYAALDEPASAYQQASEKALEAGGIDISTLDSAETINRRIELFREAEEKTREWILALGNLQDDLRRRLREADIPEDMRRGFMDGFSQQLSRFNQIQRVNQYDREIAEQAVAMLQLLRDNMAHWAFDPDARQPVFEGDNLLRQYNTHIERIKQLAEEQIELQRQVLSAPANLE